MSKYDTAGWHLIHTDSNSALVSGDSNVTITSSDVTGIWKLTATANTSDANAFARIPDQYPLEAANWTAGTFGSLEANTVYWVKTNVIEAPSTVAPDAFDGITFKLLSDTNKIQIYIPNGKTVAGYTVDFDNEVTTAGTGFSGPGGTTYYDDGLGAAPSQTYLPLSWAQTSNGWRVTGVDITNGTVHQATDAYVNLFSVNSEALPISALTVSNSDGNNENTQIIIE